MIQIGMGDEDGVQLFIRYAGTVGQQQDRRLDVLMLSTLPHRALL